MEQSVLNEVIEEYKKGMMTPSILMAIFHRDVIVQLQHEGYITDNGYFTQKFIQLAKSK